MNESERRTAEMLEGVRRFIEAKEREEQAIEEHNQGRRGRRVRVVRVHPYRHQHRPEHQPSSTT